MYSKVWPLGICLRTTFSIAKNETSSLTRIYAGSFTAQIKYPKDWQLTGVDTVGTGGRTGQSFPLHILIDKILLFCEVFIMLGAHTWSFGVSSVSVLFSKRLLSTSLKLQKFSLFWDKTLLGLKLCPREFCSDWKPRLKKHWVVHIGFGEFEDRWWQETNQTTIKSFQICLLLTHKTTKPHAALLSIYSAFSLFALFLQRTNLQLFSCQHHVWKSSPGST